MMTDKEMKEFLEKQYEWFKSLKVGDAVALSSIYRSWLTPFSKYIFVKVKNITETGSIRLENGDLIKEQSAKRIVLPIKPVEKSMIEHNRRMEKAEVIYRNIRDIIGEEMSGEDIEAIYEIMKKYLKKEGE